MTKEQYKQIENHMLEQMKDSAHDKEHIYRVLYAAMNIAKHENNTSIDTDILITACLLHDIGRSKQFENPKLCHAVEGGKMAYTFLISIGWDILRAAQVRNCIVSHRFRSTNPPKSIEAKILFDADKLDATGTMGIARTLIYQGQISTPIYKTDKHGQLINQEIDDEESFLHEYKYKLEKLYDKFYTECGKKIALNKQKSANDFFESLTSDITETYQNGITILEELL